MCNPKFNDKHLYYLFPRSRKIWAEEESSIIKKNQMLPLQHLLNDEVKDFNLLERYVYD